MSQGDSKPPLLDMAVLERLSEGPAAGNRIWLVYINDFVAQVPLLIGKLRSALTTGDVAGGMECLVGLRAAGQTVGALRLVALALALEAEVRRAAAGPDPAVRLPGLAVAHLQGIFQCAQRTIHKLEKALA